MPIPSHESHHRQCVLKIDDHCPHQPWGVSLAVHGPRSKRPPLLRYGATPGTVLFSPTPGNVSDLTDDGRFCHRTPEPSSPAPRSERQDLVESECDAGGFRSTLSVAAPFVWRCLTRLPVAPVSTPLSSNRTCGFAASGSRTRLHAFTHDGPRPSWVRRTSPKCP